MGKLRQVEALAVRHAKGSVRLGGRLCKESGECGYKRGIAAPTVFFNKSIGVRVVVHGDDFTMTGVDEELDKIEKLMGQWYEIKVRDAWAATWATTRRSRSSAAR